MGGWGRGERSAKDKKRGWFLCADDDKSGRVARRERNRRGREVTGELLLNGSARRRAASL